MSHHEVLQCLQSLHARLVFLESGRECGGPAPEESEDVTMYETPEFDRSFEVTRFIDTLLPPGTRISWAMFGNKYHGTFTNSPEPYCFLQVIGPVGGWSIKVKTLQGDTLEYPFSTRADVIDIIKNKLRLG